MGTKKEISESLSIINNELEKLSKMVEEFGGSLAFSEAEVTTEHHKGIDSLIPVKYVKPARMTVTKTHTEVICGDE